MADLFGAATKYASGEIFKQENAGNLELPFPDNSCFFRFTIDPYPPFPEDEIGGMAMIRNTMFEYNQMFYDPTDPAIFFDGQMVQYKTSNRPQPSSGRKGEPKRYRSKKSATKLAIEDIRMGFSWSENFSFTPQTFSADLETKVGGTNFLPFSGGFYMSGRVSLVKYPLFFEGESVISSPKGLVEFFDEGFDEGYYRRGVNGKVFFGHSLLDFLPLDLNIELGRATLQENVDGLDAFVRFAGEYDMDTRDFFSRIFGENFTRYFPSFSRNGQMYVSVGTNLADWEYYMMNQFQLDIAGLTTATLSGQYVHFTPQKFEIGALMELPFGLGGTELKGLIEDDGNFLLYGNINGNIPFGNGAALTGDLTLEVSNRGAFILGELVLPGSVAGIAVKGQITDQGISLEGQGEVKI